MRVQARLGLAAEAPSIPREAAAPFDVDDRGIRTVGLLSGSRKLAQTPRPTTLLQLVRPVPARIAARIDELSRSSRGIVSSRPIWLSSPELKTRFARVSRDSPRARHLPMMCCPRFRCAPGVLCSRDQSAQPNNPGSGEPIPSRSLHGIPAKSGSGRGRHACSCLSGGYLNFRSTRFTNTRRLARTFPCTVRSIVMLARTVATSSRAIERKTSSPSARRSSERPRRAAIRGNYATEIRNGRSSA